MSVEINPHIAIDGNSVAVTFTFINAGNQVAFVDYAGWELDMTLPVPDSPAKEPESLKAGCLESLIGATRALPVNNRIDGSCHRHFDAAEMANLKKDSWLKLTGNWTYHSQTGVYWQARDVEFCSVISRFCGPSNDPGMGYFDKAITDPKWIGRLKKRE